MHLKINIVLLTMFFSYCNGGKVIGKIESSIVKTLSPNIKFKYVNLKDEKIFKTDVELLMEDNDFLKNKKIISISPGGYKGFYLLGVCNYIKKHYDLSNYVFTGASAGAWNSLLMTYKKDNSKLIYDILDSDLKYKSMQSLELALKYRILNLYSSEDFDLKSLFIGVTSIEKCKLETNIFSNFDNLEDAVDCCIASSNIPFVTGNFTTIYNNKLSFDGGFSQQPYLSIRKPELHIYPFMWKEDTRRLKRLDIIKDLFSRDVNAIRLFENGYQDSQYNKEFLDSIFRDDTDYKYVCNEDPITPIDSQGRKEIDDEKECKEIKMKVVLTT